MEKNLKKKKEEEEKEEKEEEEDTIRTYEYMKWRKFQKIHNPEYGLYHFRVPTPQERKASFDCSGETTLFSKIISHEYTKFYKPMQAPGPNDWLMNHKEYGQTYREYSRFGFHQITKKKEIIYIAPLSFNINPAFDQSFLTAMIILARDYYYNMEVKLLNMNIDLSGVEYRNYEDGTYQLNANTIIEKLFNEMPDDGYCLVCLTDIDLYNDVRVIKPRKWIYYPPPYKNDFCYELISFKYWVSICSICRFDPLYLLYDVPNDDDMKIQMYFSLLKRCAKLVLKNIGYMFGLKNCIFFKCLMNGFGSMEEFDGRPLEICPCCLRKIFTNISRKYMNLNDNGRVSQDKLVYDRFKILKDSLDNNFYGIFENESQWYKERIESLYKELFYGNKDEELNYDKEK